LIPTRFREHLPWSLGEHEHPKPPPGSTATSSWLAATPSWWHDRWAGNKMVPTEPRTDHRIGASRPAGHHARRVGAWSSHRLFCPLMASPASPIIDHRAGRHATATYRPVVPYRVEPAWAALPGSRCGIWGRHTMVDASSPGQPGAEGSMAGRAAGRTAFGWQAEGMTPGACGYTAATGVTGITSVSGGCPLRDRCDAGSPDAHTSAWRAYQPAARYSQGHDGGDGHAGDGGRGDRPSLVAGWHQAVEEARHDQNPQL
jgi:hypothetical protein